MTLLEMISKIYKDKLVQLRFPIYKDGEVLCYKEIETGIVECVFETTNECNNIITWFKLQGIGDFDITSLDILTIKD